MRGARASAKRRQHRTPCITQASASQATDKYYSISRQGDNISNHVLHLDYFQIAPSKLCVFGMCYYNNFSSVAFFSYFLV